jgi:hypothetical protein
MKLDIKHYINKTISKSKSITKWEYKDLDGIKWTIKISAEFTSISYKSKKAKVKESNDIVTKDAVYSFFYSNTFFSRNDSFEFFYEIRNVIMHNKTKKIVKYMYELVLNDFIDNYKKNCT